MSKVLAIAALIVELIKQATELIKAFEIEGNGSAKKNIVLQMLETVFYAIKDRLNVDVTWDSIKSVLSGAIDAIVGFYNAVGIFKRSGK